MSLSQKEKSAVEQFKVEVRRLLGKRLLDLKLFGSKARGDNRRDSDIDLLVVVADEDWNLCDTVYAVAADIIVETGLSISPKVLSKGNLSRLAADDTAFFRNISRDAIAV